MERKKIFRLLRIFCVGMLLLLMMVASVFADSSAGSLEVNPYGNSRESVDTVKWQIINGKYYLFLPAETDLSDAKVYLNTENAVINNLEVQNGDNNPGALRVGTNTVKIGSTTYVVEVVQSADVPAVFIETRSGSLEYIHASKDNKETGDIRVYDKGKLSLDSSLKHIKGRGNASWEQEKKPYNIKFDKKTKFLGMDKAKKWTFLACASDLSLAENPFGWIFANEIGLPYISDYRVVDMFVNGEYLGTYIVCESVEVGENRVAVNDLDDANEEANPGVDIESLRRCGTDTIHGVELWPFAGSKKWVDIPKDPEDISGGYLIEFDVLDRYYSEISGFVTTTGQCVVLSSPEYASKNEVEYIYSIVNPAFEALYSESGYNSSGKHYSEYFDMDSFVNMYILQELTENLDACLSSFYMVKPEGSDKLILAPVWDLDNGYSNHSRYGSGFSGDLWWANSVYGYKYFANSFSEKPLFFYAAYKHNDFRNLVTMRWNALMAEEAVKKSINKVSKNCEQYEQSAVLNAIRWNVYGTDNPGSCLDGYRRSVRGILDFLTSRTKALTKGFAPDSAMLYYEANGGLGWLYQPYITSIGDSLEIQSPAASYDIRYLINDDNAKIVSADPKKEFDCWNTRPDGSGESYRPGDRIVLKERSTILYAQWKDKESEKPKQTVTKAGTLLGALKTCVNKITSSINKVVNEAKSGVSIITKSLKSLTSIFKRR